MAEITPRFEFRIWGQNLHREHQLLDGLAPSDPRRDSSEIYLISSATDRCNVKIRADLMDIKVLSRTERGLELWEPVLKADFPLDAASIIANIYPRLEVPAADIGPGSFSQAQFLDLIGRDSRIATVRVSKSRSQYQIEGCTAEFALVEINQRPVQTVAVESSDPDALLAMLTRLGISNSPNQSYIREIKHILAI